MTTSNRMPLALCSLLFAAVLAAGLPAIAQAPGDREYAGALALATGGKHAEGAAALEKALAQFPKHPKRLLARLRLGEALLAAGRHEPAAAALEQLLRESPPPDLRADGLNALASARLALKDEAAAARALAELFEMTERDPRLGPPTSLRYGEVLLRQGRIPEALRAFERADRWPAHADAAKAHFMLAETHRRSGNLAEAAAAFRVVSEKHWRSPWAPRAALAAGDALVGLRRWDEAEALYRRVLESNTESPEAPRAQLGLGRAAHGRAQYEVARAAFQAAALLFPEAGLGPEADLRVADTYAAERNWTEARKLYGTLAASQDRAISAEARFGFALTLQGEGQHRAAAAAFERLAEDPAMGEWRPLARARLAEVMAGTPAGSLLAQADEALAAARTAEAAALYQRALENRPSKLEGLRARSGLAQAAVLLKKPAEAEQQLAEIGKSAPPEGFLARARQQVGELHEKAGERERAIEAYRAAVAAGPDADTAPPLLFAAARLLRQAKKPAEAEPLLRELVSRHPRSPLVPEALDALAWACLEQEKPDVARPVFVRLASSYPGHPLAPGAAFRAAEVDFAAARYPVAAERYRFAAESRDPVAEQAGYKLGLALERSGDHAGAAQAFTALLERFPRTRHAADARVRAGEAFLAGGNHARALEQFEAVLSEPPANQPESELRLHARVGAARAYLAAGDPERTIPLASEAALPEHGAYGARAQLALGDALLAKEGPKAALPVYAKGVEVFAEHRGLAAELQFRAGECEEKLGNAAAALAAWAQAAERFAGTPWALRSQERIEALRAAQAKATAGARSEVRPVPPSPTPAPARKPAPKKAAPSKTVPAPKPPPQHRDRPGAAAAKAAPKPPTPRRPVGKPAGLGKPLAGRKGTR
jgi:TolA-binding protein